MIKYYFNYSGLSWLWRTWQETSPGFQAPGTQQQQQQQQPRQRPQQTFTDDLNFDGDPVPSNNNAGVLTYPSSNTSVY